MEFQILPVTALRSHELFRAFSADLGNTPTRSAEIRAAFAYVTLGGVDDFLAVLAKAQNWQAVSKRMLVGVHNAITEPAALERLRSLDRVEVRAFLPGGQLRQGTFSMSPVFHPKVIALQSGRRLRAIQAGSSNLSAAAIGQPAKNHEMGLYASSPGAEGLDHDHAFEDWWTALWDESRVVDRRFIRRYAHLRQGVLARNPIVRASVEMPDTIGEARHFFLEVGAGSGPPDARHQVEFSGALAQFFGDLVRARRDIRLQSGGQTWDGRPLSFKRTSYGVEIWRLGMPTQATGGEPIAERAIRFTRTADPLTFDYEVAEVAREEFAAWERLANLGGHLGTTQGQRPRRYGFY